MCVCVCVWGGGEGGGSLHGRGHLELAVFDRTCNTVNWVRHRGGGLGGLFIQPRNMVMELTLKISQNGPILYSQFCTI